MIRPQSGCDQKGFAQDLARAVNWRVSFRDEEAAARRVETREEGQTVRLISALGRDIL